MTSHKEYFYQARLAVKSFALTSLLDHQNMYTTFWRCSSLVPSLNLTEPLAVCSGQMMAEMQAQKYIIPEMNPQVCASITQAYLSHLVM